MFIAATAQVNQTVVLDFADNSFSIPDYSNYTSVKTAEEYTANGLTIKIDPTKNGGNFYYDQNNSALRLFKPGTKLQLPAFDFAVEKIELTGHPEAGKGYANVDMNVYVGSTAVSTATTGTTETYTYEINEEYQAAGNIYEMVVGKKAGDWSSIMYITKILVYPKASEDALTVIAPELDKAAGVYTEPITVTAYSPTAGVEGVTDVVYYYTTDGNEPDEECDETIDGKIAIESSCTLKIAVAFKYNGEEYISEATEADYIISAPAVTIAATEIKSGRCFITAEGMLATAFKNNVLPSKEVMEAGQDAVTDAAYFLYTIDLSDNYGENGPLYLIRDNLGNYLRIDAMSTTPKIQASTRPEHCDMSIEITDGKAIISANGYYIVFDKENNCFTVSSSIDENTILPAIYFEETDDEITAIENVETENVNTKTVYDLQGRSVENPTTGIYIVNGKKVFVK